MHSVNKDEKAHLEVIIIIISLKMLQTLLNLLKDAKHLFAPTAYGNIYTHRWLYQSSDPIEALSLVGIECLLTAAMATYNDGPW